MIRFLKRLGLVLPVLIVVSSLGLSGCNTNIESSPTWVDGAVDEVPSDRVLWQVTLLAFDRLGYKRARTDRASMVVESGWKNTLAPFSGDGFRTKAEVHLEPEGPSRWNVRARVKKQINKSIVNPLDPSYAEWEWVEDDSVAARILIQHIRSRFGPKFKLEERADPLNSRLKEIDDR